MLSVVCEAFGCVPSVAERELDQHGDLVFDILDLRAYARGFREYQGMGRLDDKSKRALLSDPVVQQVQQNEFDLVREASGVGDGSGGAGHADAGPRPLGG